MREYWLPDESSGEIVTPDQLENPAVLAGIAAWKDRRHGRPFPEHPGLFVGHPSAFVVEVLDGGADYLYSHVGVALVKGFDEDFSGRTVSSLIATNPKFGIGLRMLYDMVRGSGEPLGYRGWVGRDLSGAQFVYHENAILPFGPDGGAVSNLVVLTALVPRAMGLAQGLPDKLHN